MIYIIDHNDSFTHNVVHQLSRFSKVECDNFDKIDQKKIYHVVNSAWNAEKFWHVY